MLLHAAEQTEQGCTRKGEGRTPRKTKKKGPTKFVRGRQQGSNETATLYAAAARGGYSTPQQCRHREEKREWERKARRTSPYSPSKRNNTGVGKTKHRGKGRVFCTELVGEEDE
jgi:hypothetical protein